MNIEEMTEKLQEVIMKALMIAKDNKNPELTLQHLLKAFLENDDIENLLDKLKININK